MWVTLLWDRCPSRTSNTHIRTTSPGAGFSGWGRGWLLAEQQNNILSPGDKEKKETGRLWRMTVRLRCLLFSPLSTQSPDTHTLKHKKCAHWYKPVHRAARTHTYAWCTVRDITIYCIMPDRCPLKSSSLTAGDWIHNSTTESVCHDYTLI